MNNVSVIYNKLSMKTIKTWLTTIAMLLCGTTTLEAETVQIEGIWYILSDYTESNVVQVTSSTDGTKYTGTVIIPSAVEYNNKTYTVTGINVGAFKNCNELNSVIIPESVTSIYPDAFNGCSALTSVNMTNGVKKIWDRAFEDCRSLTSIVIPEGVISIGDDAFSGCYRLVSIKLPASVTTIGGEAFYGCSSLTNIVLPNNITRIEIGTFYGCMSLKSISFPQNLTFIGADAFMGCNKLASIDIPTKVTEIGGDAFRACMGLTAIDIPEGVVHIYSGAFRYCENLLSIKLPSSLRNVASHVFAGCSSLLDVYCYAKTIPSLNSDVFEDSNLENVTLHVPAAALESYKSTSPWSSFGNIVALPLSLEDGVEYESNTVENVPQITYTRTLPNLQWNALFVPFEIPVSDLADDYDVAYINDIHSYDKDLNGEIDQMEMEVIYIKERTLHANHPYLIRAKSDEVKAMSIVVTDATLYSSAKADRTSITCSSAYTDFEVIGTYEKMTAQELDGCYAINTSGAWSPIASGASLNPFRLYMTITNRDGSPVKVSQSAQARINIRVQGEDNATGITETENTKVKTENFDLSGRRVERMQKGIYIVNGKKVVR